MAVSLYQAKKHSIMEICRMMGISKPTMYSLSTEFSAIVGQDNEARVRQMTNSRDFKIPYGIEGNGNSIIHAAIASKTNKYRCPSCCSEILLKKGQVRVPHFAHKSGVSCSEETVIHRTAKLLIKSAVTNWKNGKGDSPIIRRHCSLSFCDGHLDQQLPSKVICALEEYALTGGRIADIALFDEHGIVAIIEVCHTHKVDEQKAHDYHLPWFEVDAGKIIDNPLLWECRQDFLRPFHCPECLCRESEAKKRRQYLEKELSELVRIKKIQLPPSPPYYWSIKNCYCCNKRIIVYDWDGHGFWQTKSPPAPKPSTLLFEYSETIRSKYWVNTCLFCGVIQGDHHLREGTEYWFPKDPCQEI
jgi:hypothetical protein